MNRILAFAAAVLVAASPALAGDFDLTNKSGINAVFVDMDSAVEPIRGTANGISGIVSFDPAKPESISGTITVSADSIVLTHPVMTEHMKGEMWLDVANNPDITFTIKSVSAVSKLGENRWELQTVGDFSLKGITKEITVPIQVSYLQDKAHLRAGDKVKGDILAVRAEWTISRADYGVNPGYSNTAKIGENITLNAAIIGVDPAE